MSIRLSGTNSPFGPAGFSRSERPDGWGAALRMRIPGRSLRRRLQILVGHRALGGARDELRVLRQRAAGLFGLSRLPGLHPRLELLGRQPERELVLDRIDG